MNKNRLKKIIIEIFPLLLIFIGSILLIFSLRLIDPGAGKGSVEIFGKPIIVPEQNDFLFTLGMIFFVIGSVWEIIKIIVKNFQISEQSN